MDNLKMHTPNLADENYKKLAALFPNAVTETIDENGKVVRAIDADVLRQEISASVVEGPQERYQFTWPDKKKSVMLANQPIAKTLRLDREKSVGRDGTPGSIDTDNIYIEGDNLEALKLLQETYLGKVKMIYIDPPYNTGSDAFVYDDVFDVGMSEEEGRTDYRDENGNIIWSDFFRDNPASNGRFHTDWLNMLYPRLRIAKDLLTDDGVIFISIDDNEQENLKKICDEIFGRENYQATITYVRKTSGKQDSTNFMKSTEYILVYSKGIGWECSAIIADEHVTDRYNKEDPDGRRYRETDLRKTGNSDRREDRPLMWYPFYFNPQTNDLLVFETSNNHLIENGYVEIYPIKPDNSEGRWRWGFSTAAENLQLLVAREMPKYKGKFTVYEKDYIDKKGDVRTVKEHTSWDRKEFNSDNAMLEFKNLGFSNQLFPYPKSSALIKHMVYLANCYNGIVLDFFSGSGTTAQAVMQLNAEDGGHRKFIMVQLPEVCDEKSEAYKAGYKNICEIGEERIRRAGQKIVEEKAHLTDAYRNEAFEKGEAFAEFTTSDSAKTTQSEIRKYLDVGFRVFRVDSSNMKEVYYTPAKYEQEQMEMFADNIKEDRTPEDLLFQVMLDLGIMLSSDIKETEIAGKRVFSVAGGYLIACFDSDVTDEAVTEIAKQHPFYAVFRDSGMANDSVMTNFEQIFETYSPRTQRKVL